MTKIWKIFPNFDQCFFRKKYFTLRNRCIWAKFCKFCNFSKKWLTKNFHFFSKFQEQFWKILQFLRNFYKNFWKNSQNHYVWVYLCNTRNFSTFLAVTYSVTPQNATPIRKHLILIYKRYLHETGSIGWNL